ncbi:hypothetical protein [Salinibacter ruber]|jgi:hypothetical protein|uniref:hypothetical protein n=1 Tax=Salinibacter ruber TaxID=146919 RepID=UPI002169DD39|nr:hypothetical protein [Salinibacter ruber]MCS3664516.1 hypothetical protein [Salinibacter ruber]MCS3854596.1 hypothetical protein [Salinibacter ruber]MCS4097459.1 hypothetical protein [Salinibacter ruber]MCS4154151.1 hypothetical protein [Salinibacter ruber]
MPDSEVRLRISKNKKENQPPDCIHSDRTIFEHAVIPMNLSNIDILKDFFRNFAKQDFADPFFHLAKPEYLPDTELYIYGHGGSIVNNDEVLYQCHINADKDEDYWTQEWVDIFFHWSVIDLETEEIYSTDLLGCNYLHNEYGIDWNE